MCALTGDAAQLLWDMGSEGVVTSSGLISQLRARFGSANQTALYRTQLKCRRRGKTESLSELVNDIRRLMVLAYPGPTTAVTESFACDAFLEALNDRELALKIREKEPPSLEDAYQSAMRLEAYNQTPVQSDKERKPQNVRVSHESQDSRNALPNDWREFMREFGQLQHEKFNKLSNDLKEVVTSIIQPSTTSRASADQHVGQSAQPSGGYRRRLPFGRNRECFNCGKEGHLRSQCREPSNRSNDGTTEGNSQTRSQPGQPVLGSPVNQTNHVRGDRGAYLRVKIGRHQHLALLDTGSEVTLVPSNFVSTNQMIPTDQKLQAANGSEITVLGEAELTIKVRGCDHEPTTVWW